MIVAKTATTVTGDCIMVALSFSGALDCSSGQTTKAIPIGNKMIPRANLNLCIRRNRCVSEKLIVPYELIRLSTRTVVGYYELTLTDP